MSTLTEDTTYYPSAFPTEFGDISVPQFAEDVEEIKNAEKKLQKDGNAFTIAGLLAFGTGLSLFIMSLVGLEFAGWMALLAIGGMAGLGFGMIKLLAKISKKSIKFPLLRKIKKAIRQQRSGNFQETAQAPPRSQAMGRQADSNVFEGSYVRKKLGKSTTNKVFAGVCGGIAEYAGISPSFMRFVFLIGLMMSAGVIIPVYAILALFLPSRGEK